MELYINMNVMFVGEPPGVCHDKSIPYIATTNSVLGIQQGSCIIYDKFINLCPHSVYEYPPVPNLSNTHKHVYPLNEKFVIQIR